MKHDSSQANEFKIENGNKSCAAEAWEKNNWQKISLQKNYVCENIKFKVKFSQNKAINHYVGYCMTHSSRYRRWPSSATIATRLLSFSQNT